MNPIVKVTNLTKIFNGFKAVNNISFELNEREVIGLLGPNGAGKTTTIHMLLDLITPDDGEIFIFGKSLAKDREEILSQMNFTSPYISLPYRLTVWENLMIFAKMYDIKNPQEKIQHLIELFGIKEFKNKPISYLSSGELTRVGLCKSLLNDPKLLLLDEPTASLDPEISLKVREILLKIQKEIGTTILYTSHNMYEVEKICSKIIFLNHGEIIAEGSPMEITSKILGKKSKEPALEEVFLKVAGVKSNENQ